MQNLNVLVVSRINLYPEYLADIAAVDSRIAVKEGVVQLVRELRSEGRGGAWVDNQEKQLVINPAAPDGDLDSLLTEAEVIFSMVLSPSRLIERAPKLKWLHLGTTGIDFLAPEVVKSGITITNSRGVIATPIAEHALMMMLMLGKNANRLMRSQQQKQWQRFVNLEMYDRTVGIVGLGAIGKEVARLTKGIGMKVYATRRSAVKRESGVMGVDVIYPVSELKEMLGEIDYLVIAAPLTAETEKMIGAAELKAMKPTAFVVNIARGAIIDQPALVQALKESRIAGAGLDVFAMEPLSSESELWYMPNVIISPHMSGSSDRRPMRLIKLFCDNLKKYLAGEELINTVDVSKSY